MAYFCKKLKNKCYPTLEYAHSSSLCCLVRDLESYATSEGTVGTSNSHSLIYLLNEYNDN